MCARCKIHALISWIRRCGSEQVLWISSKIVLYNSRWQSSMISVWISAYLFWEYSILRIPPPMHRVTDLQIALGTYRLSNTYRHTVNSVPYFSRRSNCLLCLHTNHLLIYYTCSITIINEKTGSLARIKL